MTALSDEESPLKRLNMEDPVLHERLGVCLPSPFSVNIRGPGGSGGADVSGMKQPAPVWGGHLRGDGSDPSICVL